jgi:single-strand DNA-binding protein
MLNTINLVGRLTHDPQLRQTTNGHAVADLRLAVDRRHARDGEDRGAVFVDVTSWDGLAQTAARCLAKGRLVAVSGRLEHDTWKAEDGSARQRHYVVADEISFLDRPPAATETQ